MAIVADDVVWGGIEASNVINHPKLRKPQPASTVDFTEDGIALQFAAAFEGKLVYDHTDEDWWIWRGVRWERDTRNETLNLGRDFVREIRAKEEARQLGKIAFTKAVLSAAAADKRLAVDHTVWMGNPMLLGTPEGTYDLQTGELTESRPDQFVSRQTLVSPATKTLLAPVWNAFLSQLTRDDFQMRMFLQRLAGYVLTGNVTEEMLAFFYGPGGNGKGVLLGAWAAVMNEYAVSVPVEVFTAGSRLQSEYYRATMAGARMVMASETESGATWAESQLKEMTGNEAPLSARNPYGKPFTFWPQFKIVLVGNYAPKLKGRSASMERRLRVIPCTNIPDAPDLTLKDKLKSEYPQILRWMMDGCAMWQSQRLGTCDAIKSATGAYFEQQDAFNRWIDERCVADQSLSTPPARLHSDYQHWAKANGEDPTSSSEFAELLDRKSGFTRIIVKGTRLIRGVGLKPDGGLYDDR